MRGADERRRGGGPEIDRIATGVRGTGGHQEGGNAGPGRMGAPNGPIRLDLQMQCVSINMRAAI